MFIVPFIYKVSKQHNMTVHSIHILTIGGTQLWEEETGLDVDRDILEPNDIHCKGSILAEDKIRFCEVDTEKTAIRDFYKWKELPLQDEETFCWRDVYCFTGEKGDFWLDIPPKEKLGPLSLARIVRTILRLKIDGKAPQKVI